MLFVNRVLRTIKGFFSGRIFLSLLSLSLAALCAFVFLPALYRDQKATLQVVRVKEKVERGARIASHHVEVVEVGSFNLPQQVLLSLQGIIGCYAQVDLYPGDFVFPEKISLFRIEQRLDSLLASGQQLLTVTPKNAAQSLAAHLRGGDFVSVAVISELRLPTGEMQRVVEYPPELSHLEVYAVENVRGSLLNVDNGARDYPALASTQAGNEDLIPKTVTFIVDGEQGALLLRAEYGGGFHLIFQERRP